MQFVSSVGQYNPGHHLSFTLYFRHIPKAELMNTNKFYHTESSWIYSPLYLKTRSRIAAPLFGFWVLYTRDIKTNSPLYIILDYNMVVALILSGHSISHIHTHTQIHYIYTHTYINWMNSSFREENLNFHNTHQNISVTYYI